MLKPNAIVGRDDHLISYLNEALAKAQRVRFNVAFLMESGVRVLAPGLQAAAARGVSIQILTGRYLGVTEPSAIYYLKDLLGEQLDIRFYNENLRSFHPKAYFFEYAKDAEVFIGSSNLSLPALAWGVEWNYRVQQSQDPTAYQRFSDAFDQLFFAYAEVITTEVLRQYTSSWRKPAFVKAEQAFERYLPDREEVFPRGAQIEALYELKKARAEGVTRGLVVAATGVGKTFIAAFDSLGFKRVLFVAHREEILRQAEQVFKAVRPGAVTGFFTGNQKDMAGDICLATVQTLARAHYLQGFTPDFFDYIVVDEFHHAAADTYLGVLNYFRPRFLLGLTATPYRTDNRDIFALCEDNVIYEIYLRDAINRDLLVPFRYFGVFDATDYSQVEYRQGKYVVEDLERQLSRQERADLVLGKYRQMAGERAIGFCVSIQHAEYMAQFFSQHGVPAVSVHSGHRSPNTLDRKAAVEALMAGNIKVLFTVDIFNEGVDIPLVDTVMFLRPTESFVVFLQQLGRGLRKAEGKEYLTVLDFIGNYKRAHYIPALLAGDNPLQPGSRRRSNPAELEYPEGCHVQFDFQVLDLFEAMARHDPLPQRMRNEFFRLWDQLGRRPSRLDVYEGSDIPLREYLARGWLCFLKEAGSLVPEEELWLDSPVEEFLRAVEKTSMTKSYKIPTIGALLEGENILPQVPLSRIGEQFMAFYTGNPLHQQDLNDASNRGWPTWGVEKFTALARKNPVHFLSKSKQFNYDEVNRVFYLQEDLVPYLSPQLALHLRDILAWKRIQYFRRRFREEKD